MKDFNEYALKAIERCNLKSYYGLAKELEISHAALHRLKTGQKLPSCNTMLKLSKLAGIPEEKALLSLATWANADKPEIQKIWLRIAKMIGCAALFLLYTACPLNAAEIKDFTLNTSKILQENKIYYATKCVIKFLRLTFLKILTFPLKNACFKGV